MGSGDTGTVVGALVGVVVMGMENDMDILKLMFKSRSTVGDEDGEMDSNPMPKYLR